MPNQHYTNTTLRDRSKETTAFKLFNGAITATSIAGFLAEYGNLKTALDNLSLLTVYRDLWVGDSTLLDPALPTDPYAQREFGLRFYYVGDTTGKEYFVTLGGPDLSLVTYSGNDDEIDITQGAEVIALVAAMEAIGRTPDDDQETITVVRAEVVGRNN